MSCHGSAAWLRNPQALCESAAPAVMVRATPSSHTPRTDGTMLRRRQHDVGGVWDQPPAGEGAEAGSSSPGNATSSKAERCCKEQERCCREGECVDNRPPNLQVLANTRSVARELHM
jgi:hypothetical protein